LCFGLFLGVIDFGYKDCYTAGQFSAINGDFFMGKDWKLWVANKAEPVLRGQRFSVWVKEIAWKAVKFAVECGRSNPVSFAVRPIMMHKNLKAAIGINLAILGLVAAVWAPRPLYGDNSAGPVSAAVAPEGEISTVTKSAIQVPIKHYSISQGFWLLHSGLDMASEIGEPIRPIMAGRVIKAEKNWFGYGNLVVVAHGKEFESWYGHMSRILVHEGQEVSLDTILGEVGSTGHSTGPHLHLEIHEDGIPINPQPILGI
jgi:hypothetical protein